jgi:hypothetical protein
MDAWRRLTPLISAAASLIATSLACTPRETVVESRTSPEPASTTTEEHSATEQRPPVTPADPGPPSLRYAEIPAGHQRLVGISQAPVFLHEGQWIFASGRPLLYTESDQGCVLFDIPSGRIVSRSVPGDIATCDRWRSMMDEPPAGLATSPDVVDRSTTLEILDAASKPRHTLACDGCEYLAYAWAPGNHRIATLVLEPPQLEIWDADAGTRIEQHSLAVPGQLADARLAWNERGVVVLVEHEDPVAARARADEEYVPHDTDLDSHEISSWFLPNSGVLQQRLHLVRNTTLADLVVDPSTRWLFEYEEQQERGGSIRRRLSTIPLTDQPSALNWIWREPGPAHEESVEKQGHWRADATTQWLETRIDSIQTGSRVALTMSWQALVTEPEPRVHGREVYRTKGIHEDRAFAKISLFGVVPSAALVEWSVDEPDGPESRFGPYHCHPIGVAPTLRHVLADCNGRTLALVDLEQADDDETLGIVMRLELELEEAEFVWGRSGWLAVRGRSGKLLLIDPDTRTTRLERDDVDALAKVALAPNLDRFGILAGDHFELIDGNSGATLRELPRFEGRAALHPDGQRLAAVISGWVHVTDVGSGERLAVWAEPELVDLAWRQDGDALLVGAGVPKRMVDASNGELLATLTAGDWQLLTPEGLDPSWRWAHLADGRILRTLDGMALSFGPTWVRLNCGLIEGKLDPGSETGGAFSYRSGEDPFAVPDLEAADVQRWLEREGVLKAFFAGDSITPPSISLSG